MLEISGKVPRSSKNMARKEKEALIARLKTEMRDAAKMLEFEHAAMIRDKIKELEEE